MIGKTVGNYKLITQLGEGGMGIVYLGEHPLIGSKVAVKMIHEELDSNPEVVSRFFTEARAVNDIRHPNIVEITDFGQFEGRSYIIMEFLEGQSLQQRLAQQGPLEERTAALITSRVASGLAAAHACGILHRDIKPDNIFLMQLPDQPDTVKILDFGIAKLMGDPLSVSHKTRTGAMVGTPYYMSPEQCLGRKEIDHRTDIYSLGIVLYEMVTSAAPFGGESMGEIIVAHAQTPPTPPRHRNPRVSEALENIILKALAKDPADRFQTMNEMRQALAPIAGLDTGTTPVPGQEGPRYANTVGAPPRPVAPTQAAPQVATPPPGQPAPGAQQPQMAPPLQPAGAAPQAPAGSPTTLGSSAVSVATTQSEPARSNKVPMVIGGVLAAAGIAVAVLFATGVVGGGSGNETTAAAGEVEQPTDPEPEGEVTPDEPEGEVTPDEPTGEPEVPPPAETPKKIEVRSKPIAEVSVGGKVIGKTPVEVEFPAGTEELEVRVAAKGFSDKTVTVQCDDRDGVDVELERIKTASKKTSTRTKRKTTRATKKTDTKKTTTTTKKKEFTPTLIE